MPQPGLLAGPIQPFLRWAGSKRRCVPFLSQFWSEDYSRYVEPFVGSAALFFAVTPKAALLGDLNGGLIETLRVVSRKPAAVSSALRRLTPGRDSYYSIRGRRVEGLSEAGRAARFIYLNRFCFNGLFRTNSTGGFNVPYGAPRNDNVPSLQQLKLCSAALSRAAIVHADFRKTLARVRAGDFVYIDPPYAVSRRRVFVEYGKAPFATEDLADLAALLRAIDKAGAAFVLSYADCSEARELFSDWPARRLRVRRNVAGFASRRRGHYDLCFSNVTFPAD